MSKLLHISDETVINKIYIFRGKKVLLDRDLAELYGVETRALIQAVKRNSERFPEDFMFQLTNQEFKNLISQIVTSSLPAGKAGWGGTRKLPFAFTEQGVAMLSSVLNSKQAISVNIQIIRVFTRMREIILSNKEILLKLEHLENKILKQDEKNSKYDEQIQLIFSYLKELLNPIAEPRKKIGYKHYDE